MRKYYKNSPLDKKKLIDYYINQNHTQKEAALYFNCGEDYLYNYIHSNHIVKDRKAVGQLESNIKKSLKENIYSNIDIETLKEMCFSRLYSKKEIADYFNISIYLLKDILKAENIKLSIPHNNSFKDIVLNHKDEFYEYYINQNHTKKEVQSHFNITSDIFLGLLKYFHIKKNSSLHSTFNSISKEELEQYYIVENHSREETINHFNLNRDSMYKILNHYKIMKKEPFEDILARVPKEELTKYYIEEKHSWIDTLKHFKISNNSIWTFWRILNHYEIYNNNPNDSQPNLRFESLLKHNNINYEREFHIGRKSFDFKIGNLLIEIDPTCSHNSTIGFMTGCAPMSPFYHSETSKLARESGYRCIHLFDWDDPKKFINMVLSKDDVYARKCKVKEVTKEEAKRFLNELHFQNYAKDKIRLGLYYREELISIMTFNKPRYNKNYEWELIRYCYSKHIIGGAEKLFKYFINNYNPNSIISYSDNSKYTGELYSHLKFSLLRSSNPTKHWCKLDGSLHITDNLLRQRGFDQLFHTNYGKGTSNEDLMLSHGFVEVYDCGQSSYVWNCIV